MPVAKTRSFFPSRIECQNVGAAGFATPGSTQRMTGGEALQLVPRQFFHVLGNVGAGADRHVHRFPIRREYDVAGVMAADRQMRNDGLGGAAGGKVAVAVGETQHGIGIADIDPLWIGSRRIKRDAERISQPGREY